MSTRLLVVLGVAAWMLASPPGVGAQLPSTPLSDPWRWVHFTDAHGLPSNAVLSAVQAPDDTLWAVTRLGVAQFDGYRWHPVPLSGLGNPSQAQLIPGPGGEFAVVLGGRLFTAEHGAPLRFRAASGEGTPRFTAGARAERGPVLLLSDGGSLWEWDGTVCRPHPWTGVGRVYALVQAGPGRAWVSGDRGLACWDGERWRMRLLARGDPFGLLTILENADESAWAFVDRPQESRGLWHWTDGGDSPRREPVPSPVTSLSRTLDGHLLAVHISGDLTVRNGNVWTPIETRNGRLVDARAVNVLPHGDVAVSTDDGLYLYQGANDRWTVHGAPHPAAVNSVNDIRRARDGTLLLATTSGIYRLAPGASLAPVPSPLDAQGPVTGLEVDRAGRTWISSGMGFRGVRWLDSRGWHRLRDDAQLDESYVHQVATDREGGVWFLGLSSTADRVPAPGAAGPGAFRLAPDGRITRWGAAQGLPDGRVYAFAEGPDGAYWFGTIRGMSRWKAGRWRVWTTADGLRLARVFALAFDKSGTLWFGQQAAGLGRMDGDRISYLDTADGLVSDRIWSVKVDPQGRLWVGAEGGVSVRQDGHWTSFDARLGLPIARVWPILPEPERVYIGTMGGGLVVLRLSAPSPVPVVAIDRPLVERSEALVRWQAFAWWGELAPAAVPTRVRLDDGPWSAWTTEREHRYLDLAPGTHRVSVQAKGLLGTPAPASAPVVLRVEPPLFRRPVVYVPIAFLSLVIAGLVAFMSVRQRRHHLELHEREERFKRVFEASPLPATITRWEDGALLDVNSAFERMTGRSRSELLSHSPMELGIVDPYDRVELLKSLERDEIVRGVAFRFRPTSGGMLDALGYFQATTLNGRRAVLMQVLDVTEQRRLEAQLQQAQKMESVGRLAGGVAHDFNNLLTVILGNSALLDAALPDGDPRRDETEQIRIAAERAAGLTRQLLAFARKQVVEPRLVRLNDVVLATDRMLRRLIGEDIELVTMTGEVGPVLADPGQLEQVLVNMAVNARDAMPSGGKLTIRTANVVIDEDDPRRDPETKPGPHVRLSVSDTGVGMDPATAARVFEPFFTTKAPGKGTGLGLATCYGIVKQAGGQIVFDTQPGRGTTFHVDLPLASSPGSHESREDESAGRRDGRETVLIVEDEVQVRRLAASILRGRGYEVFEASDGEEALALASRYASAIDLLLTDLVMPGMRGTEVGKRLSALRPGLRVLYMSGYTDDEQFRQEVGASDFEFLAKPFTPTVLSRRVREVLDRPAH